MSFSRSLRWVLSLSCIALAPVHAAILSIPYSGLGKFHLSYEAYINNTNLSEEAPQTSQVRLEVFSVSGGTTVLAEASVPRDSLFLFSGLRIVENREVGEHLFKIVAKLDNGVETILVQQTVVMQDRFITGTLLFDESIESDSPDPIGCGFVIVPDGITLDLGSHAFVGGTIQVSGSIYLMAATLDSQFPVRIVFMNPVDLASPPDGSYVLAGAGSTIDGASKVTVVAKDAVLSNIDNLSLGMELGTAKVSISDCTLTMNPWDLLATTEAIFNNCAFFDTNIYTRTGDDFLFLRCIFPSGPTVNLFKDGGKAEFRECLFRGAVRVSGKGDSDCLFVDSEFAQVVWLEERSQPIFRTNIFLGYLYFDGLSWLTDSEPSPIIESNYFMGNSAMLVPVYGQQPTSTVMIGSNYYGDESGPLVTYYDESSERLFLGDRGATVFVGFKGQGLGPLLRLAPPLTKGPGQRRDKEVPPLIWARTVLFGQNTISHKNRLTPIVAGLESLFSADVACSESELTGADIYLEVNGERIDPTRPSPDLHRDLSDYGHESAIVRAESTINFIIPPQEETIESIRLMLDASKVNEFPMSGPPTALWESNSYPVLPEPDRKLNIVVQPIRLYLYGFANTPAPSATSMIHDLANMMPAMFPISENDIDFVAASPITHTGVLSNFAWIGTYSLIGGLTARLGSVRTFMNVASWVGDRPDTQIDFVVGVVPPNGLGQGIEGSNTAVDRGILLVDSTKPTAVLHEMGHAIGLYTGKEQYNSSPPDGIEVRGATLFKTEDGYVHSFSGDGGRIRHMPTHSHSWYSHQGWIDVMGAQDVPVWPITSTLDSFRSNFQGRLNVPKEEASEEKGQIPVGMRTLVVQAMVEKIGDGTEDVHYRFVPGTLFAAPIDRGDQTYYEAADYPQQIPGQYEFRGFAEDGNRYDYQAFQLIPNVGPTEERYGLWWATFVIANSVVDRYDIVSVETGEKVLEYLPGGGVENSLSNLSSGSTLGENETIAWEANLVESPLERSGPAPPLTHHLLVSEDGGDTWQGVAAFIEGSSLELVTEFLKAGDDISIRLQSTDGLKTVDAQVDHLRIENRPPSVRIHAPLDGDRAPVGHAWSLYGSAYDLDDRRLVEGWWTSSRDGFLASGSSASGVVLSPGPHDLVFHASDSNHAEGAASVQILIATGTEYDFELNEEALRLRGPGSNPSHPGIESLSVDSLHSAKLALRSDGAETDLSLWLYLERPAQSEILLASQEFRLEAFETAILAATFEVESSGSHAFRGEVLVSGDRDPNLLNNQRVWNYPAVGPEPSTTPTPSMTSTPTLTPTPTRTIEPARFDLDGDQNLTPFDLFLFSMDWSVHTHPGESRPADFDDDSRCDSRDLLELLKALRLEN